MCNDYGNEMAYADYKEALGQPSMTIKSPIVDRATRRNVQESLASNGSAVGQEVMRYDYVALSRGRFAYATALVDGFRTSETLLTEPTLGCRAEIAPSGDAPGYELDLPAKRRPALHLEPYYRTGGRQHGAWRLRWLGVSPFGDPAP